MISRESLKQKFFTENSIDVKEIIQIPGDASFRSYERIKTNGKSYILMDAPPEKEDTASFIKVAEFLKKVKLSVPSVYAKDSKHGFLLLEDFGDDTYGKILSTPEVDTAYEVDLYQNAIDALLKLQQSKVQPDQVLPYYDDELLMKELRIFTDWYVPITNGETLTSKQQEEFEIIWQHLFQYTRFLPETTVLRDYHAANLMLIADRKGIEGVGILDFQDAVIGSPAYDLVSLLEDARRDITTELAENMITYYLSKRPDIIRKDFFASYAILGAQRNLKILGIFARKAARDKNSSYLKLLPRVWSYIEKDLRHPLLLPLKSWLVKIVPNQKLNNPSKIFKI